jgi:CubicO group peptidase (beta-lactamase class C family)
VPQLPKECNRAIGYSPGKKQPWRPTWGTRPDRAETALTVGDGAIWTNLEDMAHWDAILRAGKLLKPETVKLSLTPSHTRDGERNDYGLGWELFANKKGKLHGFGHEGSWEGFETSYYRYLPEDRTTVILSNRGNFGPDELWYKLNDAIDAQ